MDLVAAILTLRELIGQPAALTRAESHTATDIPFRVAVIDFLASRENRCIVGRTLPNGTYESLRRSVTDITADRKYFVADTAIADATVEDVREALSAPSDDLPVSCDVRFHAVVSDHIVGRSSQSHSRLPPCP